MKITARNIGVDAGCIMISDFSFYQQYGGDLSSIGMCNDYFDIERGLYRVKYKVLHTWKEKAPEGEFLLNLASGCLIVSDPCYMIDELWDKFLEDTDMCNISPENTQIIDTGGDGSFIVKLDLIKERKKNGR